MLCLFFFLVILTFCLQVCDSEEVQRRWWWWRGRPWTRRTLKRHKLELYLFLLKVTGGGGVFHNYTHTQSRTLTLHTFTHQRGVFMDLCRHPQYCTSTSAPPFICGNVSRIFAGCQLPTSRRVTDWVPYATYHFWGQPEVSLSHLQLNLTAPWHIYRPRPGFPQKTRLRFHFENGIGSLRFLSLHSHNFLYSVFLTLRTTGTGSASRLCLHSAKLRLVP